MKIDVSLLSFITLMSGLCFGQSEKIDSLQHAISRHTNDTNEIRTMSVLADEYMRIDIGKAKNYVYRQIELSKALNTNFGLSSAYARLIAIYQNEGQLDSAYYFLCLLEALAKDTMDKKAAINFAQAAGLYYKNQGNYRKALPFLLLSLELNDSSDKVSQAGSFLNVGNAYSNMGNLRKAVDFHLKALVAFEEAKNLRGQSFCLNSLGVDFLELEQYDDAESYFIRSEKLKAQLGDKRGVIACWLNLGRIYQKKQKFELSLQYFNKALELAQDLKLTLEETRILFNTGLLLKQIRRTKEATKIFDQALTLAKQMGDSVLILKINANLIATKNELQTIEIEEQVFLQNIETSLENKALNYAANSHIQLAEWYEVHQQFDKALKHLKLGYQLNDSILGSKVALQVKRIEEEYKTTKKEKEIVLLKKDRELQALMLSKQRVIITSSLVTLVLVIIIGLIILNRNKVTSITKSLLEIEKVRNSIARDLHDDIGSTLSSINILSKVARMDKIGNKEDYLRQIGDQSTLMMENLSDMVWSINPNNDSISQVLIKMREFANDILEPKNIVYHFAEKVNVDLILNATQSKNIFLFFKEAINNAAKYSHATCIEISLYQYDKWIKLSVVDNGQGFDLNKVAKGNGLRNFTKRAEALDGFHTINSEINKGTKVELQLPIA